MLIQLDKESEQYLAKILIAENVESHDLIKELLRRHLQEIESKPKTIVERRGGHPKHLLENAPANLSSREIRKPLVYEAIRAKHERRQLY